MPDGQKPGLFLIRQRKYGQPNDDFAPYFTGQSYLAPISTSQVGIFNVTFEPKCRNNWHIHHAKEGGGQILICIAGRGYYQEWETGRKPPLIISYEQDC